MYHQKGTCEIRTQKNIDAENLRKKILGGGEYVEDKVKRKLKYSRCDITI